LLRVADRIVEEPALSTRAAILRVIRNRPNQAADLRRLQDKFRRDEMIAAATQRKAKAGEVAAASVAAGCRSFGAWAAREAAFVGALGPVAQLRALGIFNTPPLPPAFVKMIENQQRAIDIAKASRLFLLPEHELRDLSRFKKQMGF
jgi:hypothetical protein